MAQDIRLAWRFLWNAPISTSLAVITLPLAVALGAGTLALGASPRHIMAQIAAMGLRLTLAGLAIGMPTGALASRLIAALLYGVSPRDPAVFVMVPAAIVIVSIPAWLGPAKRAAGANPVEALRHT